MADANKSLREMTDDEFVKTLTGGAAPPRESTAATLPRSVNPETQAALAAASDLVRVRPPDDYVAPEAQRMGIRPGAFLDISKGADKGTRFGLGMDENQVSQLKYLASNYGPENVDISENGQFILRNQPTANGTPEDVMVNPAGLDGGDLVEMLGQMGYQGGGGVGGIVGGLLSKHPIGRVFTGALGMAIGGGAGGAIQDAIVRYRRGQPVDISDIAAYRGGMALIDAPLGVLFAGTGKTGTKLVEGALGVGVLFERTQIANTSRAGRALGMGTSPTQRAAAELEAQTGVAYPLTPGEAAGPDTAMGRLFLRAEATASGRVGSATAADKATAAKQQAEDELRRVFLGAPRTMTDDELRLLTSAEGTGERALQRLRTEAESLSDATLAAQTQVARTGTAEAQQLAGVNLAQRLDPTAVGGTLRSRASGDFTAGQGALGQRYDEFFGRPELRTRSISGNALADVAAAVESDLTPQAVRTRAVNTGILDAQGNPITYEREQLERLDAFVNGKVRTFLDSLQGMRGARVAVNDLKQIRTGIDSAIAEGVAIPGVDVAQLRELRGRVTGVIGESLNDIDPALNAQWQALNNDYAAHMGRFDRTGIRELLIREGEKGSLGSTEIAERVLGDSARAKDIYDGYRNFLGAQSPEFQQLRQVVAENALYGSISDVTPFVDGARLRAGVRNLRREIAEDVFGANRQELSRIGEVLEAAQSRNIDVDELRTLLRSRRGITAQGLRDLIGAETERAAAYNNKLIKAAADGTLDAERIRPSDFVRHASNMDPREAQRIMGILGDRPDLVQDINRLAIDRIWGQAQSESATSGGARLISPKTLNKVLDGPNPERAADQRATWRTLAGNDAINGLEALARTVSARGYNTDAFKSSIAGPMDVNRLILKGEVGMLPEVAHRWLLAFAYSGPLKRATTNMLVGQDRGRFLNAIISSTPFIQETREMFGAEAVPLMEYYRGVVEREQKREISGGTFRAMPDEEFEKVLRNNSPSRPPQERQ